MTSRKMNLLRRLLPSLKRVQKTVKPIFGLNRFENSMQNHKLFQRSFVMPYRKNHKYYCRCEYYKADYLRG